MLQPTLHQSLPLSPHISVLELYIPSSHPLFSSSCTKKSLTVTSFPILLQNVLHYIHFPHYYLDLLILTEITCFLCRALLWASTTEKHSLVHHGTALFFPVCLFFRYCFYSCLAYNKKKLFNTTFIYVPFQKKFSSWALYHLLNLAQLDF